MVKNGKCVNFNGLADFSMVYIIFLVDIKRGIST